MSGCVPADSGAKTVVASGTVAASVRSARPVDAAGFLMTPNQLGNLEVVAAAFLGELFDAIRDDPELLELKVGAGPWLPFGHLTPDVPGDLGRR